MTDYHINSSTATKMAATSLTFPISMPVLHSEILPRPRSQKWRSQKAPGSRLRDRQGRKSPCRGIGQLLFRHAKV
jgi:hypothetical protein